MINRLNILCFRDSGAFLLQIGKKQDIFKRYSLEVSIKFTKNADQTHDMLLTNTSNYDIILMSYDDYLFCKDQAKMSSQNLQSPLVLIPIHDGFLSLVTSHKNINSFSDLKGTKIAIDTSTGYASFLFKILEENEININDIDIVFAGATDLRYEKLLNKEFDATLLGVPFTYMAQEKGCKIISNLSENRKYAGQVATINALIFSEKFNSIMAFKKAFNDILVYLWDHQNKDNIKTYLTDIFGSLSSQIQENIYERLTDKKNGYCWNGFFDNDALILTQILYDQNKC
ncbi:ABC transporter substrate-binding protein [Geminocystis sp. NIES-3709]|uniref:ABC transporter substrate-binding protein n=1 Tax=Geminocystis sp. NIES-3709 TaxID=1617448 RepID=UPI0005FCC121|nr:ABC transporter substrate-binding protein [Geminocystis sp. NIES-3709]BAQ65635.1 putative periplasmic protein [Geminocystis sp. NIES-3709]